MIIKKENNDTIIKQLTELFDKAFEHALDETIKDNNTLKAIKNSNKQETSINELSTLTTFIDDWIDHTANDPFYYYYTPLMREDEAYDVYWLFHGETDNRNFTDKELLARIKQYNGSIKESLLAVVKPVLVERFVLELINSLEAALDLLLVVNNYNDYDYHLQRFIEAFEENLLKRHEFKEPLALLGVWWLDETFLKDTIIPELKNRVLTEEQKQKAAIHSSCKDLVNNYYDYCLYYAFSRDNNLIRKDLFDTTFFYEKEDFVKTISIIKKALLFNEEVFDEDLEVNYGLLLKQTRETKPEWVDTLRPLLSSY